MPLKDTNAEAGPSVSAQEALDFHASGRPGKLEINPTKPMATQRDLSLAYSPGVAAPVKAIAEDPSRAFDYTARGNLVAVISNGTSILGLGDLGALASKPVMEGKAVLFKRFADVDSIDIEVDTRDADEFINCVRYLGPSFGGINLEDIKAPECFIIEQRLRELMDIPVFHDDQHGTAIIAAAGLINALEITGRDMKTARLVCNGAGSAGIACIELVKAMGFAPENVILCDTKGVVYKGRKEGMNQWKSAHAIETDKRTLAEAMDGADVVFGLSAKGAFTTAMIQSLAKNPIIFAMANPDPEITPEEVAEIRTDAIMATGRSDYPNQVNNVLGFPYIFRGALDARATTINDAMKIAAAKALAALAREDVPDDLAGQVRRHWASITRNPAEAAADAEIHLRFDWSRHPDMSAVRAALSAHIGEDRIQAHESAQADEMRRLFCIAVIPTLILLNCRNAVEAPETPAPEKLNRQRAKKGKPPLPAHRTIRVSLTAGAARHAGVDRAGASMDRRSPRGGLVTGHFKVRATGVYWWSPHWRGRSGDDSPDRTYVVVP